VLHFLLGPATLPLGLRWTVAVWGPGDVRSVWGSALRTGLSPLPPASPVY